MKTKIQHTVKSIAMALLMALGTQAATVGFDNCEPNTPLAHHIENGVVVSAPNMHVLNGYAAGWLFGLQRYEYGNVIYNNDQSWLSICMSGQLMTNVNFLGGSNWNFQLIQNNLIDVTFEWKAMRNGVEVDSGFTLWGDRQHTFFGNVSGLFDDLLVRVTATGGGERNYIALDRINVTTVPDSGGLMLIVMSVITICLFRKQ